MNSRRLVFLLLVGLLLAPLGAAQGQGNPHGGPPGHDGHPHNGPPGHEGNQTGDGGDPEDPGPSEGNIAEEVTTNILNRACRLVEWDGGDPEPGVNPVLGLLWLDPERCITSAMDLAVQILE